MRWISDGSGEFEVSDAENVPFSRGTQIKCFVRPDCREFTKPRELKAILTKFSQFISHPIKLNGKVINSMKALWYRNKKEVSNDDYEKFYESIANTKIPYKYVLHYAADVPLAIKSLIYFPSTNPEKFSMQPETSSVSLYSRKVMIKQNCQELLPGYLRFVKGIVDCEDLPLNISRENYQDSHLINKLKNVLTRRILKNLEDEMKKDEEKYNVWYKEFQNFLKEGISMDTENQQQLLRLTRYQSTFSSSPVALDDYIKRMKKDQRKIYFLVATDAGVAKNSPFLEPFKGKNSPPVLFLENHIDEMCLRQVNEYKGFKFVNIETNFEEIAKDVDHRVEVDKLHGLPEEDTTSFCLWIKSELEPFVSKVSISRRLKASPAVIVGDVSASMRVMMKMMDQSQFDEASKNQVLEINPNHPIITRLNTIRKINPSLASMIAKSFLDTIFLNTGLPIDTHVSTERSYKIMEDYLADKIAAQGTEDDIVIEQEDDTEGIMDAAEKQRTKRKGTVNQEIEV